MKEVIEALETLCLPMTYHNIAVRKLWTDIGPVDDFSRGALSRVIALGLTAVDLSGNAAGNPENYPVDSLVGIWNAPSAIEDLNLSSAILSGPLLRMIASLLVTSPTDSVVRSLTSLNLSNCEFVSDAMCSELLKHLQSIRILNISNCTSLTPIALVHLETSYCAANYLEELNYSYNMVTLPLLRQALAVMTHLRWLSLEHVVTCEEKYIRSESGTILCVYEKDSTVPSMPLDVWSSTSPMRSLNLSGLHTISTADMERTLCSIFPFLNEIVLRMSPLDGDALLRLIDSVENPTEHDNHIEPDDDALSVHALSLRVVDLEWCGELSANSIEMLLTRNEPEVLQQLSLRAVSCVESSLLMRVMPFCRSLVKLNLARCDDVDDRGAEAIAASCQRLRFLDISWSSVTDAGLLCCLRSCSVLEVLSLQGCKHLTYITFAALMSVRHRDDAVAERYYEIGNRLHFLDFSWVNMFSTTMAAQLSRCRPMTHVVGEM